MGNTLGKMGALCACLLLLSASLLLGQGTTDTASRPRPPLMAAARQSAEEVLKQAYHLEPRTIQEDAVFKAHDAEIAAVWEAAKERRRELIAALQKMLPGEGMIPYFYYDGAMLLLSLEDSPSNYQLPASCLQHTTRPDSRATDAAHRAALGPRGRVSRPSCALG